MIRIVSLAAVTLALGAAGVAWALQASTSGTQAPAKVKVTLKEWTVVPSVRVAPAGKVTFIVRNAGTIEHELVVMKTSLPPRGLAIVGGKAKEVNVQGEIEEFGPRLTKRLTLTLAPGKYLLLCNLPGHYAKGQVARLVVR